MADQFLDGKTMKLAKNGSNVVILHFFMTVLAAVFCTAC